MSEIPENHRNRWFVEIPTEGLKDENGRATLIVASKIRDVTDEDVEQDMKLAAEGKCPCRIVYDTPGYMYDIRTCAICGRGRGLV